MTENDEREISNTDEKFPDDPANPAESGGPSLRPTKWFYITMVFAQFAVYASIGAVIAVILPAMTAAISGEGKIGALGVITAVGAVGALVAQPLIGRISDRTTWRFGRRMTWVAVSGVISAITLFSLSFAGTIGALVIGVLILQLANNSVVAMINTSLPDRVPVDHRARASGALGIALAVGAACGIILAGFLPSINVAWTVLSILVLVATLLFAFTNNDIPAPRAILQEAPTTIDGTGSRRSRLSSLPRNPDYWWAFASKFAIFMTYQSITSYLFYILSDDIQLTKNYPGMEVAQTVSLVSIVSLVSLTVVSAIGGVVADKVGRLKPFVLWSAVGFAAPGIILILSPTLLGLIIAQIVSGAAFGLYAVVDQALLSRVIPHRENAARDLGILNIASAVPNVAAPLVAGILISSLGGYNSLFIFAAVFALLGAVLIRPVRSVA